jgi:hypothetical protein
MLPPEQNRYKVDLGETKIIWHIDTPIIVPNNFTIEQEMYVKAALTTLHYGNTSVDHVLKRYYSDFEDILSANKEKVKEGMTFKFNSLIDEILKYQKFGFEKIDAKLSGFNFDGDSESIYVCGLIFKRLTSSFGAVRTLINQGFYFETYSIMRQMFEQLAFAYRTSQKNTYDEFESPTKSISFLKNFYPYAGEFYGKLSSKTHIDKTQFKNYHIIDDNNEGQIILRSTEFSINVALDFIIIFDLYCSVFEYLFHTKIEELEYIHRYKLLLKDRRPTHPFFNYVFEKRKEILKSELISLNSIKENE